MQKNLLDTHALIWYLGGADDLSQKARSAIETEDAINFVSIASLWEIAIKISLKKLDLNAPFEQIIVQIRENGFRLLPITFQDTLLVSNLFFHHRDPFDRILIAQSIANNLVLLSGDKNFGLYDVSLL